MGARGQCNARIGKDEFEDDWQGLEYVLGEPWIENSLRWGLRRGREGGLGGSKADLGWLGQGYVLVQDIVGSLIIIYVQTVVYVFHGQRFPLPH